MYFLCLFLLLLIFTDCNHVNNFVCKDVNEVDFGKTAVLCCRSNDFEHNFMFWQLPMSKGGVIGPGNGYNKTKYDYEVLSGKLFIKRVTMKEEGYYDCISRGVRNNNINIRTVQLIVKKDWGDAFEHDASINFFIVIIIIGTFVIVFGVSYLLYKNWRNKQIPESYLLQSDDEDSGEEIFTSPGSSKNIILEKQFSGVYDNQSLSTDFKSILNNK